MGGRQRVGVVSDRMNDGRKGYAGGGRGEGRGEGGKEEGAMEGGREEGGEQETEEVRNERRKETHVIFWVRMEFFLVLQMIKSAHCTTTMLTKNAVWHVYSRILRWL